MKIKNKFNFFSNVIFRQLPFFYKFYRTPSSKEGIRIMGMIRERNEGILLQDSLDHLSQFVDAIVVFDDASDDNSVAIAMAHPAVVEVVQNRVWRKTNRLWEETSNRRKLLSTARKYNPNWFFYADADERFEGDIKNFLLNECPDDVNAIRVSLFDSYITESDKEPYISGNKLHNFRTYFGPERRDIIMLWRNIKEFNYNVPDAREPQRISGKQLIRFYCQHYGKSLSIEQWEETCDYYVKYFPKYSEKWLARKGKAVHQKSDFDRELYAWADVKEKSVKI
jgi:glycosyltransferase involved in cell wall biosynthesis